MRTTTILAKIWNTIRSSYWFVPSLMTLAAIAAAAITTVADHAIGPSWLGSLHWLMVDTPAGARTLLGTVAGSMMTVAGVTFSITIVAVAYATANLGARLLSNFMRNGGNQVTLGTFIATFMYCILVLRTVHGPGEGAPDNESFIPYIGIMTALALTLCSLGVLIYFIHHVAYSISAFEVIARLGEELRDGLDERFPARIGKEPPAAHPQPDPDEAFPPARGAPIRATAQGYLTHFDPPSLIEVACDHDAVIRFVRRPGDFVSPGEIVAYAHGMDAEDAALHDGVRAALIVERERTPDQDTLFIAQQLTQIAARALSPGVNDPYTANGCVNWLGNALTAFGRIEAPSPFRFAPGGQLCVIAPCLTFADLAAAVFDELRPYVARDRNAALHTLTVIGRLLDNIENAGHRALLLDHADALKTAVEAEIGDPRDREAFLRLYAGLRSAG